MRHPTKDAIYFVTYPRSGSNWFRYCFSFITETEIDKDILFHSHSLANDRWNVKKHLDVKSILLLRDYKECLISEMKAHYTRPRPGDGINRFTQQQLIQTQLSGFAQQQMIQQNTNFENENIVFFMENTIEIVKHIATEINPKLANWKPEEWLQNVEYSKNNSEFTQNNAAFNALHSVVIRYSPHQRYALESYYNWAKNNVYDVLKETIDIIFDDFLLSGFPTFETDHRKLDVMNTPIESVLSLSVANHYYFALQLIRYYEMLEYHDRVSKINPNNTLLIKYEAFIKDPFDALNRTINFMERSHTATSDQIKTFRNNLDKLMENIKYHKSVSIAEYKSAGLREGKPLAQSYKEDPVHSFHSSICRKEFLMKIDDVFKNKNLELYNKYLSEYEEVNKTT